MVNTQKTNKPTVLSIAAHDPTGGAGIQADIETISANGGYPLSIITAFTEQTLSNGVSAIHPLEIKTFKSQLESITKEFSIDAIKIGVIANFEQLDCLIHVFKNTNISIVLDPVIKSTSGFNFYDDEFINRLINDLMPLCSVLTPNKQEASEIFSHVACNNAYEFLTAIAMQSILVTSAENTDTLLTHTLITKNSELNFGYQNLPGEYHGSGCTLSSAIATRLSYKEPLEKAVKNALDYTWQTLNTASIKINNTYIPNRFFN